MGLLDRFKRKPEDIKDQKAKHKEKKKQLEAKKRKEGESERLKKQFQAVPAAGKLPEKAVVRREEQVPRERQEKETKKRVTKDNTGEAYRILIKPLLTEKASSLQMDRQYAFIVAPGANKIAIKRAIQSLYGVKPQRVRVMKVRGKQVKTGRIEGWTKNWKKAIITLSPGEKIEIREGV